MEYEQGSTQKIYATFADADGEAASISGTPVVTIMHDQGTVTQYDVNEQAMTQLSGVTYYYNWAIPARADRTTYTAKFDAVICGASFTPLYGIGATDFQVITRRFYDKKGGGFVQRIKADVWTKKEKEAVLETLQQLFGRKVNLSSVEGRVDKISKSLGYLSKNVDFYRKALDSGIKELKDKEVPEYDEAKVVLKIGELEQRVLKLFEENKLDPVIKEVKGVQGDLTNLKEELEELKKAVVMSASDEAVAKYNDQAK